MRKILMREKVAVRGYKNKADLYLEEQDTSIAGNKYPFAVGVEGFGGSGHWNLKDAKAKFQQVKKGLMRR